MDRILVSKKDHIALATINHPPANTWDLETMEDFEAVVSDLATDSDVRVVVITGAGNKCFSAGFDVKDAANAPTISLKGRELWRCIDRFPKPVIAAINGFALGGGFELAMACHFRIMADDPDVMVGLTELNLGIIPGWGGTQRLPRLVGRSKALEMILFSQRIGAEEALRAGLVDKISSKEKILEDAMELAARLADRPPIAVKCVLESLSAGLYEGLEAGLTVEAEGSKRVRETEDRKEGFKAFIEKRKPHFVGK